MGGKYENWTEAVVASVWHRLPGKLEGIVGLLRLNISVIRLVLYIKINIYNSIFARENCGVSLDEDPGQIEGISDLLRLRYQDFSVPKDNYTQTYICQRVLLLQSGHSCIQIY